MRKSTNYNLNLAEGNDIVNPLVIDVPNYEIIDEELKNNSNSGVTTATELLTGTVHTLTRINKDAPVFRFVATSNYRSGETFTVDGEQVTALMATGEPLSSGAYVINSNVLCCLTGTLLTVFTCMGGEYTAYDSARLGGKPASDYATNDAVNNAVDLAQASLNVANSFGEKLGNRYVVESGRIGIWDYIKYADGTAECWGTKSISIPKSPTQWGSLYKQTMSAEDYPFQFAETPHQILTLGTHSGTYWAMPTANSPTSTGTYYALRANTSNSDLSGVLSVYVKGKWN